METLDFIIYAGMIILGIAFIYIIWSYAKGLKDSPYEIYLLFFTKVTEYSAYGAINISFVLFLSKDMGLSDVQAGTFMGIYSTFMTLLVMVVGPFCDAIGIKKTLLFGAVMLLFSRLMLPFMPNLPLAVIFGFFPMAFGIAITGPVISVGIKRFTTEETAALGFGLFYTLMNVGWAIGAQIFDSMRGWLGEHELYNFFSLFGIENPPLQIELSTYQWIFLLGFAINIPDFIAIVSMRDGVALNEDREITIKPFSIMSKGKSFFGMLLHTIADTSVKTWKKLVNVFFEKTFWVFMLMLFLTVFVRIVFEHFHYTFPKYGIRLLGDGAKIGSVYGVLNPTLIVFLVPLVAAITRKIKSFPMLFSGILISSASVFIAAIPLDFFSFLNDTWFSTLVYDRWLGVPADRQTELYFALISFVVIFTIGEALWSPRLMQFAAQVAPKGKEGSYISLAVLPYFFAKLAAGPFSGWLVSTYTPLLEELEGDPGIIAAPERYANHYFVWLWVGGIAMLSPIGLLIFKKLFKAAENHDIEKNSPKETAEETE